MRPRALAGAVLIAGAALLPARAGLSVVLDAPVAAPEATPTPSPSRDGDGGGTPTAGKDGLAEAAGPPRAPSPEALAAPARPRDPVRSRTLLFSGAVLLAAPLAGELTWWREEDHESFHRTNEGWFGHDTYAGGADKASHVVGGYLVSRELAIQYQRLGNSPARSRALALGMTTLSGLIIEAGDGFSVYGFAWEDILANVVGAAMAGGISAARADDLVGLRWGYVRTRIPPADGRATAYGSDYSREIYSADLKLAGVARRLHGNAGPARFLLVSATYGTKGYRFSPVERRERNVGLDVGLNVPEILTAVGVRETTWWGQALLKFFTYYRLEYTSWGWRYDLNHRRWSGFGTGSRFDPGKVIYQ